MQSELYRHSRESRVFDAVNVVALSTFVAFIAYPLVYTLVMSLNNPVFPNQYFYLWTDHPTLEGYAALLTNDMLLRSIFNSLGYVTAGSLLAIALTMATAYPLSIGSLPFRGFFTFVLVVPMLFGGGLIPFYLLIRNLGMMNTPWVMIVPSALSPFMVIIARTYLQTNVPSELREAAKVDGAGEWRILWSVALPLSKPIVAVVGLLHALGIWNGYFNALIFLQDESLHPLALVLRNIISGLHVPLTANLGSSGLMLYTVEAAIAVVAMVPVAIAYPFVQRYFTKGLTIGAIKG